MNTWEILMLVAGGLFAGGAATFAWSRVPIWRRMPLPQFLTDFAQTLQWTDKIQPALLVVAITSSVLFAVTTTDGAPRMFAALGAAGLTLTLIASLAVMVPLQRKIIRSSVDRPEVVEELRARWFQGNLGRSAIATASFALTAAAAAI